MKSNHPFNMFGSWIGAGFGAAFMFLFGRFIPLIRQIGCTFDYASGAGQCWSSMTHLLFIQIPIGLIIGLLIGWGIHSLVRRFS